MCIYVAYHLYFSRTLKVQNFTVRVCIRIPFYLNNLDNSSQLQKLSIADELCSLHQTLESNCNRNESYLLTTFPILQASIPIVIFLINSISLFHLKNILTKHPSSDLGAGGNMGRENQ